MRYLGIALAVVALLWCAQGYAQEYPVVPSNIQLFSNHPNMDRKDGLNSKPVTSNAPVWKGLEQMSQEERENSRINLALGRKASDEALQMARRIEALWNGGRYGEALALFPELAKLTPASEMEIGNAWRTPVQTKETIPWGNDVRIGNRDSVDKVNLDIHRASGNLFAVLYGEGDGEANLWTVNLSTDGGTTWVETYMWWASYSFPFISTSVVGNDCYVAYATQAEERMRRFNTSDGLEHYFSGGGAFVTVFTASSDSVKEVALCANQDYYNNRLYTAAITYNGSLRFFWTDTAAVTYTEITTGVTNADRGLDVCTNQGYDSLYTWTSYYDQSNNLQVSATNTSDQWSPKITYATGTTGSFAFSSIGAYNDTIMTVFQYTSWVRYLTSYAGGVGWYYGDVGGDTTVRSESPDVALRGHGGEGIIYRYYTPTRELRYVWRNYAGGWPTPVNLADNEPYYNKPAIEYLGSSVYGIVYCSWYSPVERGAYFDRSDWLGVEEGNTRIAPQTGFELASARPNPLSRSTSIAFSLPKSGEVSLAVYDIAGRKVATLAQGTMSAGSHEVSWNGAKAPAGVYLYRLSFEGKTLTNRMVVVR